MNELDQKLGDYARTSGHQVLVYVDHTTGGVPIEDWAVKAFERWKVGRKGIDDGLVLFIMADDRALRIEVGYGLEPTMTDTRASRIIREAIVPRIRAGDHDGAVRAGVDAILSTLGGAGESPAPVADQPIPKGKLVGGVVVMLILLVAFVGFAMTHPGLAWLLTTMIGSGRRGGWGGGGGWSGGGGWGGGGGFSGGGGRSGGGGASGSW